MNCVFHPEAETEFVSGIEYYEDCEQGLGLDFAREVHAAIQHVLAYPFTWPVLEGEVRRCLVHRFPYGVLYSIEPDGLFILAIMHLHRRPDYWRERRSG